MPKSSLWVEEYRPTSLSDVPVQEKIIKDLKGFVKKGSIPHMIFAGPVGSGKTMAALGLAGDLYGGNQDQYFLKVNCSNGGVMVRRKPLPGEGGGEIQKAKRRKRVTGTNKRLRLRGEILNHIRSPAMGKIAHKLLYLLDFDEEDSQTQNALRRPMETYSENCRFVFSVENTSNIIDPLLSRCAIFRFGRPSVEDISKMLKNIARKEDVEFTEDGIEAVIEVSNRNLVYAINLLQAVFSVEKKVDKKLVYESIDSFRTGELKNMVITAFRGDFQGARKSLMDMLIEGGSNPGELLHEIQKEIYDLDAPDPVKIKLIEKIGKYDHNLTQGKNKRIQLENVLAHIARIGERIRH